MGVEQKKLFKSKSYLIPIKIIRDSKRIEHSNYLDHKKGIPSVSWIDVYKAMYEDGLMPEYVKVGVDYTRCSRRYVFRSGDVYDAIVDDAYGESIFPHEVLIESKDGCVPCEVVITSKNSDGIYIPPITYVTIKGTNLNICINDSEMIAYTCLMSTLGWASVRKFIKKEIKYKIYG